MPSKRRSNPRQLPPNRLAELREAQDWKPYNVAHLLEDLTGQSVDPSTVWRWEQGGTIRDSDKFALAELYGVSIAYLMGWSESRGSDGKRTAA